MRPSLLAELRARPVLASGRGIAFVEDGVDDLEDGGEPLGALVAARDLEGNLGLGQRAFRADDALGDGPFGDEKGARDPFRRQSAYDAQSEGDTRLFGQQRMAGGEGQAEQIVANVVVEARGGIGLLS